VSAAVTRAQRWRNGRQHWALDGRDLFDPARYGMAEINKTMARQFTVRHHYSATFPATKLHYGLFELAGRKPLLVGVVALGIPMRNLVLTNVFPHLLPNSEALELNRLVCAPSVGFNGESWFCARAFRAAAEHGVRGLVAFCDPLERWAVTNDGRRRYKRGHCGVVYQALGFDYLGRATPRTLDFLPDGTLLSARATAKVTGGERGHQGVFARLVALGAPPPTADQTPCEWLREAKHVVGVRSQRHPGNHRYAIRLGRTRGERTRTVIGMATGRYPKPDLQLPLPPIP
jgi:hypothetical protein